VRGQLPERTDGRLAVLDRHVDVDGATLRFHFTGKSGKKHVVELHDRRVAQVVKRCREIPGHHLFEYLDEQGLEQNALFPQFLQALIELQGANSEERGMLESISNHVKKRKGMPNYRLGL